MESTFASRIRQYRQDRGLSQQALAELCGLTQGNIAHMENGTEPKQSNVSKLLAGLPDLSPDWLLNGNGPMLRDGRALSPVVTEEKTTARKSMEAVQESTEVIYLKERLAEERRQREWMQSLIDQLIGQTGSKELPGKLSDSDYAAVVMNEIGFHASKKLAQTNAEVKILGNLLPMQVDGALFILTEAGAIERLDASHMQPVTITEPLKKTA